MAQTRAPSTGLLVLLVGLSGVTARLDMSKDPEHPQLARRDTHVQMAVDWTSQPSVLLETDLGTKATSFMNYKSKYGRTYADSSPEHEIRMRLFRKRVAEIEAHNAKPNSWKAAINKFTDRTDDELLMYRGYKKPRVSGGLSRRAASPSSLLEASEGELREETLQSNATRSCGHAAKCAAGSICNLVGECSPNVKDLPKEKDWVKVLQSSSNIMDQRSCGSCWAIASAGVLELLHEKLTKASMEVSPQGMLGCTPNPDECGGQGGCEGATPELAFNWASKNGVSTNAEQPYSATSDCPVASGAGNLMGGVSSAVKVADYMTLPINQAAPVYQGLLQVGPLAVAVAAGDWFSFDSGVFSCQGDLTVDHAVVMMGYGVEDGQEYWNIRNSWGPSWGEQGYIRLARHSAKEPCGTDHDMQKGVGCKNDPKEATVCGECGVLSDVVYPILDKHQTPQIL